MTSAIDPTFCDVVGPVPLSAALDPTSRPGLREALATAANEIDALQDGTGIDLSGLTTADPALEDIFLFRSVSGVVTRSATLAQIRDSSISGRIITAPSIGLVGDGVTDDSPALNQAIATWSATGGAYFLLRPPTDNGAFYFASPIFIRANCILQFIGPSPLLAKGASFVITGRVAYTPTANRLRLLADGTAGDSDLQVDTSSQGGGAVSGFFAVDDYVLVEGLLDAAGNVVESQETRITAVDDTAKTITLADIAAYDFDQLYVNDDYEAYAGIENRTLVAKIVTTLATSDIGQGDYVVAVTPATKGAFSLGDYVLVQDDAMDGGEPINIEPSRIINIDGDGADTITLDRPLQRAFATADNARLIKIAPVTGAGIWGCSPLYTEAPDATVHPFEMRRALGCSSGDCQLTNADLYGYSGNGFRVWQSVQCTWQDIAVYYPRHQAAGEGVGVATLYTRDCYVRNAYFAGCREDMLVAGATNATFSSIESLDNRYKALSLAGLNSYGTILTEFRISAGSTYATSDKTAISIGSAAFVTGDFDTSIKDGKIQNLGGGNAWAVRVYAPSVNVLFDSVEMRTVKTAFYFRDHELDGTIFAQNIRWQDCHFDNIQDWIVDVDGGGNGSTDRTIKDLIFRSCHFVDVGKMFQVTQADTFKLFGNVLDQLSVDVTEPYVIKAVDVTDLVVHGGVVNQAIKGFSLIDCPDFRIAGITLMDQDGSTEVLFDGGGCDGGEWRLVDTPGFTPTANLTGASSITFYPFPIGGNYLTDS